MKKLIIIAALATLSLNVNAQRTPPKVPVLVKTDTLNVTTTYEDESGKFVTKELPTLCALYRSESGQEQWIYGVLATTGIRESQVIKRIPPKTHN